MSGHSKWAQIKHQKAAGDAKKGQVFSKMGKFITLAAKKGGDPNFNAVLRDAVSRAKAVNMPLDKIERAIKKGSGELGAENLEEVRYEVFGPGGSALVVEGITDNKNRTSNEIKHLLSQNGGKLAEQGSVMWSFVKTPDGKWSAKHTMELPAEEKEKLQRLVRLLDENEDIQNVYTNVL